ncbi:conserved hypothetical protein [Histoplasma capsulatum var. duboisii H88]|uniref:Ubiquitin fusion degradation protein n=1 Tax=Ajellomyces capsulatus (strain H88) TaxID=544711 RepID=F0UI75_AJEC8|nr:conserved hypothetical protein [Histoplasma capsulatum var. duboisii H88]
MAQGQLWATLMTAIDPLNTKAMPIVLQSTIHLLETELANARAALQEIQGHPATATSASISSSPASTSCYCTAMHETIATGAMAAYKHHLVGRVSQITSSSLLLSHTPASISLLDLLSNSLILDHIAPYLSISSLLSLASTCTAFHSIIMDTPYVFRHMDLTTCRAAQPPPSMGPIDAGGEVWRSERMDESLTEDDFYSGPLRGIFSGLGRRSILQDVRTLILDGLSVPADLIADIILTDRFNVVLLSIRDCLNLNERKLMQTLQASGKVLRKAMPNGWAETLQLCNGIISFDAVLCRSPAHQPFVSVEGNDTQPPRYLSPAIATVALGPRGCEGCRTSPEGPALWSHSPEYQFPLLTPPPLHSSRIIAAKSPVFSANDQPALIMQCQECLINRWCNRCGSWWCSACLPHPEKPRHHAKLHQTASQSSPSSSSSSGSGEGGGGSSHPKVSAEIVGNAELLAAPAKQKSSGLVLPARVSIALSTMMDAPIQSAIGAIPAGGDRGFLDRCQSSTEYLTLCTSWLDISHFGLPGQHIQQR